MRTNKVYPYLLIAPALLLIGLVNLYPTAYSVYLSLNRSRRGELEFVGLRNYVTIMRSPAFWESLQTTVVFGIGFVLLTLCCAFALALAFKRGVKLSGVYMAIIFIPWMLSDIVSGVMFRWLFLPNIGFAQRVLGPLVNHVNLLGDPVGAMSVVIGATVWQATAFAMLLILAGMQTIPKELYESAVIDGATRWQSFWHITWALVRPTTVVTLLFLTIQAINVTGMFLAITDGGPGRATEVLSVRMYREALTFFNFGSAATLSVLMFLLNAVLAAIYLRTLRSETGLA